MKGYSNQLLLIVVFLGLAIPSRANAQAFTATEYAITNTPKWETTPRLGNTGSFDLVVYTSSNLLPDGSMSKGDIWYQRLNQGRPEGAPVQVTNDGQDNQLNDVSGDFIVYTAYDSVSSMSGRIMVYQISTSLLYGVGSSLIIQEPRISANKVVWREGGATASQVMLYDLAWLGTARDADIIAGPIPPTFTVDIGDRFVVWAEQTASQRDIVAYDLGLGTKRAITDTPLIVEQEPSTSGPWITWQAQDKGVAASRILALNLDTQELRTIADNGVYNYRPSIDGDLIAYESMASGALDIYIYRISTQETFRVTRGGVDHYLNDVFGNSVAYVDQRTGNEDIYLSVVNFGPPVISESCTFITGIVGCYPFEGNANDFSGNSHHAILHGGTFVGDKFGTSSSALALNGTDEYASIADAGAFGLQEFTIAAIVKIPAPRLEDNWIVSKGDNFGNYSLSVLGQNSQSWPGYAAYVHQVSDGNWSALASNSAIPTNKFIHLAVTLSSGEYRAYLNGVLQKTVSNPPSPMLNGNDVVVGAGGVLGLTSFFQGAIDDFRIYNRALTPDEIAALYNKTFNAMPVAEAGPDQSVVTVNSTVNLDARQSYDDDGDLLTYQWDFAQKPASSGATLSDKSSATPNFVADVYGTYILQLIVSDPWTKSKPDAMTVSFENLKPVADAGGNQAVTVWNTVTLDAKGSYDPNGDSLTYAWSFLSKPQGSAATFSNPNVKVSSFIADKSGTYLVQLIVNDGFLNSTPDVATITATATASDVITTLNQAITTVNQLDSQSFKNKNRRDVFTGKIGKAIELIDQGNYADALDKLQNDILGKTDGCAAIGAPDNNDWILDCTAQSQVYALIMKSIELLSLL